MGTYENTKKKKKSLYFIFLYSAVILFKADFVAKID